MAAASSAEGATGPGDPSPRLRADLAALERLQAATGALLGAGFDLARVVQTVSDAATELSGAELGAFFYDVVAETGESSRRYALSGAPRAAFDGLGLPRDTPILGAAHTGTGVVRLHDVTTDPRYGRLPPHHGLPAGHRPVRSYLAVPVTGRDGGVLGGLLCGHSQPGVFGEAHERAVGTIAGHAAVAMESARLYERQRSAAATLQHGLLPEDLPDVAGLALAAGYRPAARQHEVGGDWYDATALPDGRLAVSVGDVCGHDLHAAATMGQLSAALRAYVVEDPDPVEVVGRLDRFCTAAAIGAFTTLAYALFDPADRTLRLTLAGHPPPVLREPSGAVGLLEARPAAAPVGCGLVGRPALEAATSSHVLAPGATVVLYTDGLVERPGAPIREGIDELLAVVARAPGDVEALARHVIDVLGHEGRDDVVLLALRVAR